VLAASLLTRIRAYVRVHLRDPELSPDQIAAAHHNSRRYLLRLCQDAGLSLEQWIIAQRLAGARADLAKPGDRGIGLLPLSHATGGSSTLRTSAAGSDSSTA
jgi:AraC-like DNA-binding protein